MLRLFFFVLLGAVLVNGRGDAQPTEGLSRELRATEPKARAGKAYALSPNDVVQLKGYQEDDLQAQVRVGKDGIVTLPLIGQVRIGGLTTEEASAVITAAFEDGYLVNPQ